MRSAFGDIVSLLTVGEADLIAIYAIWEGSEVVYVGSAVTSQTRRDFHPELRLENRVWDSYKRSAEFRQYEWTLSEEQFDTLISQDCHYCGCMPSNISKYKNLTGFEFIYQGIDRVNNSVGYTINNVVPCCTICNGAKTNLSYDDFMRWIDTIVSFRK